MYSTINKSKWGDCTQCGHKDTDCVKQGKVLICLNCNRNNKAKAQLQKQKVKNQVRSLKNTTHNLQNKEDSDKQKWFKLIRTKLTGTCQCGCGQPSQKNDEMYYRSSCCHIFPQKTFKSVQFNPLNYVERAFWGGCHTNMDDRSMDRWVNMADWQDIREKFFILAPELTEMERTTKFYNQLSNLVYTHKN